MASIISAGTTSGTALNFTGDTTGNLAFQTGAGANTITVPNATGTAILANASNNLQMNSGYGSDATAYGCRAWVNFNGTGTVAIRASGNVSSITDNGTGDYTVNLTNAMPDINYATVVTYSQDYGVARCVGTQLYFNGTSGAEVAPTTTTARFVTTSAIANFDAKYVCVSIFR